MTYLLAALLGAFIVVAGYAALVLHLEDRTYVSPEHRRLLDVELPPNLCLEGPE